MKISQKSEYALRAMMRQDPDVILIGEIRDSFSLSTALRAADTGHLVFTTVHATNAPMTVERMVSLFLPSRGCREDHSLDKTQTCTCIVTACPG